MCEQVKHEMCVHRVPIFEHLSDEEACRLHASLTTKSYEKGEFIFREGEKSDKLFILNKGMVKVSKIADNGKEQILRLVFPGEFFGQFAFLNDKTHYANAEALDACTVCFVHKKDFFAIMEHNAKTAYRFLRALTERLGQADEWIGTIGLLEVERRLAKLLLYFYERGGKQGHVRLPISKKEAAALIGTTPETLSRKLSFFEDEQIIVVKGKTIEILNLERLKAHAG